MKTLYLQVRKGRAKTNRYNTINDEVEDMLATETDEGLDESFNLCTADEFSVHCASEHELMPSLSGGKDLIAHCEYESLVFDEMGGPVLSNCRILQIIDKRSAKLPVDSLSKIIFFEQLTIGADHGAQMSPHLSGIISLDQLVHA
jgi:hypothetical protein